MMKKNRRLQCDASLQVFWILPQRTPNTHGREYFGQTFKSDEQVRLYCPSQNNLGNQSEPRQLWSGRTGHRRSRLLFRMTSFFMRRTIPQAKQVVRTEWHRCLAGRARKTGVPESRK